MNFILSIVIALIAVHLVVFIPWVGISAFDLHGLFGIWIPYAALLTFVLGIIYRVVGWGRSAVPFRIPTTAGQGMSMPWVKTNPVESPKGLGGVIVRMLFEVLTFRSLFRHNRMEFRNTENGPKIDFEWEKWLWLSALLFHYCFLVIFLRHFRFFMEPIPGFVHLLESLDGFVQLGIVPLSGLGVPGVYLTDMLIMLALAYLIVRRIYIGQIRYLSLPADFFPLFLILALAQTGIFMRYLIRVDITAVKTLAIGLFTFNPPPTDVLEGIGVIFYIHLFTLCTLIAYFPFSKLTHMAGVFLSPTRNLANNNRAVRHINPWNYPVKYHTYEAYEDEFRERMMEAGLPVEKGLEKEETE